MREQTITIIDGQNGARAVEVPATLGGDGAVRLSRDAARAALGCDLEAEAVGLAELAARLGRPLALEVPERAACVGASAAERGRALAAGRAPDFALPDLDGRLHTLAEHRGRKVLLVAYASW